MKILIVEDEPKTGDYLRQGLVEAGFVVDLARDGLDGLHLAMSGAHDLIVLDVMLPSLDGWGVLQTVRRNGQEMPVLFLTARDRVEDRVRGLELGADDYLVKPFAFAELSARVRALLRRESASDPVLTVGPLALDQPRFVATRDGKQLELTAKEFSLLHYFMANPGIVMSQEHLLEHVWDEMTDPLTNVVRVTVSNLRKKLGDPPLITTVPGRGYKLEEG